jgi:DNA-binding CsgD family transcriptional regulator
VLRAARPRRGDDQPRHGNQGHHQTGGRRDAWRSIDLLAPPFRAGTAPLHEVAQLPAATLVEQRTGTAICAGYRTQRLAPLRAPDGLQDFEEIGTTLWADRIRAELARAEVVPTHDLALTPSERRVAELAASGMTNKDVATALFISPKTLEANLARVLSASSASTHGRNSAASSATAKDVNS